MLATKKLAGVAPEVNLRILFREDAWNQGDPPWVWNPGQMSPEVKKGDVSDPTKRTWCSRKI